MNEKQLLSVKEASKMFGIGQHRIRDILREDYEFRYHLMVGRVIRIKRESFKNFINQVEQV